MRIQTSMSVTRYTQFGDVEHVPSLQSTRVELRENVVYVTCLWLDDAKGAEWLRQLADAMDAAAADSLVNTTTDAQAIAIVNEQPIPDALADAVGIEREPKP